jgi:hypothetical protein
VRPTSFFRKSDSSDIDDVCTGKAAAGFGKEAKTFQGGSVTGIKGFHLYCFKFYLGSLFNAAFLLFQAKQQGQTDNAREYLKQALAFNKLIGRTHVVIFY